MKIKKVSVRGFQALKKVDLVLGGLTVIVGESNVGKSSFIRAIKAVADNASGTAYINRACGKAAVGIELDNGILVVWEKTKSASYKIKAGDSIEEFNKVGTSVPEEVCNILRMGVIDIGGVIKFTPNFHGQFSLPFLTDESSSKIAKILGELSGVNILYIATQEANLQVRRNNQNRQRMDSELTELKAEAKRFKGLKERGVILDSIKSLIADGDEVIDKINGIASSVASIEQESRLVSKVESDIRVYSPINKVTVAPIEDMASRLDSLNDYVFNVGKAAEEVGLKEVEVKTAKNNIKTTDGDLKTFMDEIGICPLCEQPLEGSKQ